MDPAFDQRHVEVARVEDGRVESRSNHATPSLSHCKLQVICCHVSLQIRCDWADPPTVAAVACNLVLDGISHNRYATMYSVSSAATLGNDAPGLCLHLGRDKLLQVGSFREDVVCSVSYRLQSLVVVDDRFKATSSTLIGR